MKVFSREAMEILQSYSWPGNIRELENIVERALYIAQGPVVKLDSPAEGNFIFTAGCLPRYSKQSAVIL